MNHIKAQSMFRKTTMDHANDIEDSLGSLIQHSAGLELANAEIKRCLRTLAEVISRANTLDSAGRPLGLSMTEEETRLIHHVYEKYNIFNTIN